MLASLSPCIPNSGGTTVPPRPGPRAQEIVNRFRKPCLRAYLFSPLDAAKVQNAEGSQENDAASGGKLPRGHRSRRRPGERYSVDSYRVAIARACNRAFPPPDHLRRQLLPTGKCETLGRCLARLTEVERSELREWKRRHRWHPHRLRHTKATEVMAKLG